MIEQIFYEILVAIGTIAFAASGTIKGIRHGLDLLGIVVLGFVTAIGGGLLRDVMVIRIPVVFIDLGPVTFALLGCIFGYLYHRYFMKHKTKGHEEDSKAFMVIDAIGLAVFTLAGARMGVEAGLNVFGIILLAALTGVGGGVIRDILVREVPLILKEDFYATVTVIGGILFALLVWLSVAISLASLITLVVTLLLRLLAIRYKWQLPKLG